MKAGQAVMVRRDTGEKVTTPAKLGGVKYHAMAAMFDFITGEGLLVVSIESRFDTSRSMQVYSVNSSTNLA